MKEWLPENFTPPADRASEIARTAVKRGKARRRNERIALSCCSFLFVAAFTFMAVRDLRPVGGSPTANVNPAVPTNLIPTPSPVIEAAQAAQPANRAPGGPDQNNPAANPAPAASSDLNVLRVDHSVAITWEGTGTYAVYKCDSPKFDTCSIMEVVEGNSYLDKDENSGKIVYYRIEPLAKRG